MATPVVEPTPPAGPADGRTGTLPGVEVIDRPEYGPDDVAQVTGGDSDPFGTDHLGIVWREKSDHVALVDDGRLIGCAGWVVTEVCVAGGPDVEVFGLGGVIVHAAHRGRGIGAQLVDGAMRRMRSGGGSLAMLFCRPERLAFYGRLGWVPIEDEVTVEQPGGLIVMPLRTCWTPLVAGGVLPEGSLRLKGLPF